MQATSMSCLLACLDRALRECWLCPLRPPLTYSASLWDLQNSTGCRCRLCVGVVCLGFVLQPWHIQLCNWVHVQVNKRRHMVSHSLSLGTESQVESLTSLDRNGSTILIPTPALEEGSSTGYDSTHAVSVAGGAFSHSEGATEGQQH